MNLQNYCNLILRNIKRYNIMAFINRKYYMVIIIYILKIVYIDKNGSF